MRCSLTLLTLLLSLPACHKEPAGFDPVMGAIAGTETPARVLLGAAVGQGSVRVPVRLVNAYGAAVGAGETVNLSVQGVDLSVTTATVTLDGWGWGELEVQSATPQAITVTATGNSAGVPNGDPVVAWIAGAGLPDFAMHRAWAEAEPPDKLVPVNGGVAWASGGSIMVQPFEFGAVPLQVASLPGDVDGLIGGDIDSDGLPDLVAWSGDEGYVLRGRSGGGFGWVTAFTADYGEITGAAMGDFDDDLAVDIVFVWSSSGQGGFQPFGHNGLWGFEAMPPLDLGDEPWSISAGTPSTLGADEVIILYDGGTDGRIRRFGLRSEGWTPVGVDVYGYDLDRALPLGSTIDGVADLDGDGLDDLVFAQPIDGDGGRAMFIVSYGNGVMTRQYEKPGLRYYVGDLSGDGLADVLLAEQEENLLHLLTVDTEEETGLYNRTLATDTWGEGLAVASVDGDSIRDALVSADVILAFGGADDEEHNLRWVVRDEGMTPLYAGAVGPLAVVDGDGDGASEALVFRLSSDGIYLYQYPLVWDASTGILTMDTTTNFGRVGVGDGSAGLDVAICDGVVYALGDDGRLVAADPANAMDRLASVDIPGALAIDCGPLDGATLAVLQMGGEVALFNANLSERGTLDFPGAVDIAVARLSGADAEVVTCSDVGCSILAEDLDGDGLDEVLTVGSSTQLSVGGVDQTLAVSGLPSVADIDSDGRPDLLFTDTNLARVGMVRSLSGAFAPPILLHSRETLAGPGHAVDVDGDGVNELVFLGESGRLTVTRPSSTVVVEE